MAQRETPWIKEHPEYKKFYKYTGKYFNAKSFPMKKFFEWKMNHYEELSNKAFREDYDAWIAAGRPE